MKIDHISSIRPANDLEAYIMGVYKQKARYVVLDCNGEEYSVQFDDKRLAEFLPSRTVSEMLKSWQDSINATIVKLQTALETNHHPYWMANAKTMHPITDTWTGQYHKVPYEMNKEERKSIEKQLKDLEKISGEFSFVKIVPFDFTIGKLCTVYTNTIKTTKQHVKIRKETEKTIVVEGINKGVMYESDEPTGRFYTIKKSDIELIHYL